MGGVPDQGEPGSLQGTTQANALTSSKAFKTSDGVTITYRTVGEGVIKIFLREWPGLLSLVRASNSQGYQEEPGGEKLSLSHGIIVVCSITQRAQRT